MPTFITVGYGDRAGYDQTDPEVRNAAHAHDQWLRAHQAGVMGIAGTPVQVRNADGAGVETTDGPFSSALLPVAGFAVLEAADLAAAIELASKSPCAVAQGVVEVWPLHTG